MHRPIPKTYEEWRDLTGFSEESWEDFQKQPPDLQEEIILILSDPNEVVLMRYAKLVEGLGGAPADGDLN